MKKKFITMLCIVAINYAVGTSAYAYTNSNNETDIIQSNNTEKITLQTTSSAAVKVSQLSSNPKKEKYSFKDLNQLNNQELIEVISEISWEDISDLFNYNADSYAFYSNKERVQVLIDALYEKGCTYTANDDKGISTLSEVLRSGFYLAFYNDSLKYLNDRSFHDKCIPAMLAIEDNENFKLGGPGQDKAILALGRLIGNASCNVEVVNKAVPILDQYYNKIDEYLADKSKSDAVFELIKEINYDISQYTFEHNIRDGNNTPWSGNIDSFIDATSKFAAIKKVTGQNDWLINNGIFYTGKFAKYHSNPNIPHSVIDDCLKFSPTSSKQYFYALDSLKNDFDSKDSNGNVIDLNKILNEQKTVILPKTYSFDDGKIIIKAGDKVSESKIQRLYWASKEVKAQFHRVIENDKPLENGNADDVLTIVIYNNPEDYKINSVLYGYDVNNGGIYIESIGTFFTYERTEKDSIYSLEELFRHEYTHYLQGRYLIPGLFNQGAFYKEDNSRITWFEEGSAEFFAGSTRTTVLPRKSMVGGISEDSNQRFKTDKLLHSKYSDGWDFYKYGYAFTDYMYNDNKKLFNDLVDTMKTDNVKKYENLIKNTIQNSRVNKDYQNHMQELSVHCNDYQTPLVSNAYMQKYADKNLSEVKSDIEKSMGLTNSKISKESSECFDTYTLESTYTLDSDNGKIENWNLMNNKVNEALNRLDNLGWEGYKTVTAYFSNPKVNSHNQVKYDVVFHGLLSRNKNFKEEATTSVEDPKTTNVDEKIKNESLQGNPVFEKEYNDSFEEANKVELNELVAGCVDSSNSNDTFYFNVTKPGDITITLEKTNKEDSQCNWLLYDDKNKDNYMAFPDSKMNQLCKTVKIDAPGKYYLLVYQYSGEKTNYKFKVAGTNATIDKETYITEKEYNNSFETANRICKKEVMKANLNDSDDRDTYYFDALTDGTINVTLENMDDDSSVVNWVAFSSDNTNDYIGYASQKEGNKFSGSFKVDKPGRYYIVAYKISGNKSDYNLKINGDIKEA